MKDVIGRVLFLYEVKKERLSRINQVCEELQRLWSNFNFPSVSKQVVIAKVEKLLNKYTKNRKRKYSMFDKELATVFDITKNNGTWLCKEDRELYAKQLKTGGKVGYRTHKIASPSSIHPSKRRYQQSNSEAACSSNSFLHVNESVSVSSNNDESEQVVYETSSNCSSERSIKLCMTRSSTDAASKLVTKHGLSTRKASVVCASLASSEAQVATPSQSGIWRRVVREGSLIPERIKMVFRKKRITVCISMGK